MTNITHLRIFLASPGDVSQERQLALKVLEELPYDPAFRGKISVETVAWDKPGAGTPMLAGMTPQQAIAEGLPKPSECDIVIVILWSRMGTPLPLEYAKPDGKPYLSGTEWEYCDAKQAWDRHKKPVILLYRRTEKLLLDPDEEGFEEKLGQRKKVQAFFEAFRNPDGSISSGVNGYADPAQFGKALSLHLRKIIHDFLFTNEQENLPITRFQTEERFLDVAMPQQVVVHEATELLTMIRLPDSEGLRKILHEQSEFQAQPKDVSSKPFEVNFPNEESGNPTFIDFLIRIKTNDFEIPERHKKIRLNASKDSETCIFILTPLRSGELRLLVQVFLLDTLIKEGFLKVNGFTSLGKQIKDLKNYITTMSLGIFATGKEQPIKRRVKKPRTHQAVNIGNGAVAQGNHAVAASHGSIAVGGNVGGNVQLIHASDDAKVYLGTTPDPTAELDEKLARYYRHLAIECRRLPLEVIDSKFLDGQEVRLPDIYVPLHALRRGSGPEEPQVRQEEEKRLSVLDALAKERRAVLLGEPGSGKTVLVNYLAGCLAEAAAGGKLDDDIPDTIKPLLPIRLILREVAAAYFPHSVKAADTLLWQAVRDDLCRRLNVTQIDEVFNRLQTRIRQTGALFFLDGLDEVPESGGRRKALLESVRQLVDNGKNCRFLVTARPYAYAQPVNRLPGFPVLELVPFDENQRNTFISGWYRAMQSYIGMSQSNADYKAQSLQTAAQRPELVELASRPLLLTLMATLHTSRGTLPKDRAKLYDDSVELLLGSWQRRRLERGPDGQTVAEAAMMQVLDSDLEEIRKLMELLAFTVHERQRSEGGKSVADITEGEVLAAFRPLLDDENSPFKSKALLDYLDTQAGLLIARAERGPYAFPHRSFQEYLAASHLCRRSGFPKRFRELAEQDALWWREVFLLGVGAAGEGNLADMINALVPRDADKIALPSDSHWRLSVLAGLALVEQNVKDKLSQDDALQAVYERVQAWLVRFICEGHLQAVERAEAGTVLGQLGDPRFDPALWHLPAEPLLGFRPVSAGVFTMGSDKAKDDMAFDNESPPHRIELPMFFMARWPVTVAQFAAFVQASAYQPNNPRCLQGVANHPVVYVSWQDAIAYCQWLDERLKVIAPQHCRSGLARDNGSAGLDDSRASPLRFWQGLAEGTLHVTLPSEAEWEYAARGTDGRRYPWGHSPDPQKANYGDTGLLGTSAVGCFPAGISPFSLEDLSGNVWEWTRSLFDKYPYPKPGEQRQQREDLKAEGPRVLRGGAFGYVSGSARCSYRLDYDPGYRGSFVGFRVVVSPFL